MHSAQCSSTTVCVSETGCHGRVLTCQGSTVECAAPMSEMDENNLKKWGGAAAPTPLYDIHIHKLLTEACPLHDTSSVFV